MNKKKTEFSKNPKRVTCYSQWFLTTGYDHIKKKSWKDDTKNSLKPSNIENF